MAFSLDCLPARPPTPPKGLDGLDQSVNDALQFLQNDLTTTLSRPSDRTQSQPLVTPPATSPPSSQDQNTGSYNNNRKTVTKRVDFSPWTNYHRPPDYNQQDRGLSPLKPLLPSRELKPFQSILKQSPKSPPSSSGGLACSSTSPPAGRFFHSVEEMLNFMLDQLEHGDAKAKADTYVSLSGTLGACECLPDKINGNMLDDRMDRLIHYIKRDSTLTACETNITETGLITQSLRLLFILLLTPTLSKSIKDEVRVFVIERAIQVLQDPVSSKAVIKYYISMLAQQRFSSSVMTSDRAERLLDILQDVEERVKGNSVVGGRLSIYQRMLTQARSVLLSKIDGVLEHVFHGMLSSIPDIQKRAIEFGTHLGVNLGKNSKSHRALINLFATECDTEGNLDYGSFYATRLLKMFQNKDHRKSVPQIWAVAILFFQNRGHRLQKWRHAKSWLRLIQYCLNCSDASVRFQAYYAWNRLVSVINPDRSTSEEMINMLIQPLSLQLRRTENSKASIQVKQFALSSYWNLLYYSFRPSASPEDIEHFWNIYVKAQLADLLTHGPDYADKANQILSGLFHDGGRIPWDEVRANNPEPLKSRELPRLSAKWLRRRVSVVLPLVEQSLEADSQRTIARKDVSSSHTWESLMEALAEASSQEVKASLELREAIAQIINSLYSLWDKVISRQKHGSSPTAASMALFSDITYSAMDKLGSLHFTQKILVQKGSTTFEVAPSPSHRSYRSAKRMQSPFQCIFRLMALSFFSVGPPQLIQIRLAKLVQLACASQSTRQAKLSLLHECMDVVAELAAQGDPILPHVWSVIANEMNEAFECTPTTYSEAQLHPEQEFQEAVSILCMAIRLDVESISASRSLFISLTTTIKREVGDKAAALDVIGPVASVINSCKINMSLTNFLHYTSLILTHGPEMQGQQSLERGHQTLWGLQSPDQDSRLSEPFEEVYYLVEVSLQHCRGHRVLDSLSAICEFLSALAAFVDSSPQSFKSIVLRRIQKGLSFIVEDEEGLYSSVEELSQSLIILWRSVNKALGCLLHDTSLLKDLAPLIAAGLRSRHKVIVEMLVNSWNHIFEETETMEYPEEVESALRGLSSRIDLDLPATSNECDNNMNGTQTAVSQPTKTFAHVRLGEHREASTKAKEPISPQRSAQAVSSSKGEHVPTPSARRISSPISPTPKTRLRHDDSQVEFTAIESSPADFSALESQLLTEHQKEVRSQQQAGAAAMFPDIRSSSGSRTRRANDTQQQRNGLALVDRKVRIEEPATPSPPYGPMDDFLSSSPTPGSAAKRDLIMADEIPCTFDRREPSFDDVGEDEDLPSSPPEHLNDDEGTAARRPEKHVFVNTEQLPENGKTKLKESTATDFEEDSVEEKHLTLSIRESSPEPSAGPLGSKHKNNEIEVRNLQTETNNKANDLEDETELQKQSLNHGERVMSGTSRTGDNMLEVDVREPVSSEATANLSDKQSEQDPCRTKSDAFVDAPSSIIERKSNAAEEPEIFVDASQSLLDMPRVDVGRLPVSETEGNGPQISIEENNQDAIETDESSMVGDSFVVEAEQPLSQVSSGNQQTVRKLSLQQAGSQFSPTNFVAPPIKTRKRKRSSQDTIKARRPLKKRKSPPFESVRANVQIEEEDDVQDCITVLPPTSVPVQNRQESIPTSQRDPFLSRPTKRKTTQLPNSVTTRMESEARLTQRKRKAPPEELGKGEKARKLGSGENVDSKAHPDSSDIYSEVDATDDEPRAGSAKLSHVEIVRSQHVREGSLKQIDESVDDLPEAPSLNSVRADDTHAEDTVVDPTEEDVVDAAGRTAERLDADDAEASQQLVSEQAAAQQAARRLAQPKSIIERLKGILAECKGAVFGSQERLEMYDTLAEVHAEVRKRTEHGGW